MKSNLSWFTKLCFSGFLFLLLAPPFSIVFKNQLIAIKSLYLAQSNQEQVIPEKSSEEIASDFQTMLSLINFLLAGLTVVPILSAFLLWSFKEQIRSEISSEVKKKIEEEIKNEIASGTKKLEELESMGYIELIRFSVTEELVPIIRNEYGRTFRRAIKDGFPSLAILETIEPSKKEKIKQYTDLFAKLLDNHPGIFKETLYENYSWIGEAYFLLNQPKEALRFYEKALYGETGDGQTPYSEDSRTLCNYGNVLKSESQFEQAIEKYNEASDIEENSSNYNKDLHSWITYHRADAKFSLLQYQDAIADYDKAYSINHDNYISLYWKGNALAGLGNLSEALSAYELALATLKRAKTSLKLDDVEYKPALTWILHGMGDAYRKIGYSCYLGDHDCQNQERCKTENLCYSKAIEHYDKALESSTSNDQKFEILHKLGKTWRQLGKHSKALQKYEDAIDICSTKKREHIPNLLANWASVLQELGAVEDAKQKFHEAMQQCYAKICQCNHGKEKNRRDCLDEAGCYLDIARCYSLQKEPAKANKNLKKAAASGSPMYGDLLKEWIRTDSDFENLYRWNRQQELKANQSTTSSPSIS